ncbi:30S ribosomal protein S4e [archaeon]|jgi:small subunit ribosomal protein S4e|nr:30S ribosomal protein S4e [archaeon]MDP6548258.1 30S ribosomal protein S4e [Candidatus Woesearchaeota archaeon]|tara:strand:+ start:15754 stop:16449 length:696 start_codon:yes stop_codon:yes gene_type:complete
MSKHLNRHFAPKTWKIKRKGIKYITKPSPGPHKKSISVPLNVVLRDILDYASNNKESRHILETKNVTIDGIRRKDYRFPVGLFDVLSLNEIDEHFRIILTKMGKIDLIKVSKDESSIKICKITGKSVVKGKIQLNLYDGKSKLVTDKSYKVGDSILLSLGKGKNEIKKHVGLGKNVLVYLTGGKHIGQVGKVQDIKGNRIVYKSENGDVVETLKEYAFPVGEEKPLITLSN